MVYASALRTADARHRGRDVAQFFNQCGAQRLQSCVFFDGFATRRIEKVTFGRAEQNPSKAAVVTSGLADMIDHFRQPGITATSVQQRIGYVTYQAWRAPTNPTGGAPASAAGRQALRQRRWASSLRAAVPRGQLAAAPPSLRAAPRCQAVVERRLQSLEAVDIDAGFSASA